MERKYGATSQQTSSVTFGKKWAQGETDIMNPFYKKQLLFNISNIIKYDRRTGVHRVTRGLLSALFQNTPKNWLIRPIYGDVDRKGFFYANKMLRETWGFKEFPAKDIPVSYNIGDIFLGGIDFSPEVDFAQEKELLQMQQQGVNLYFMVYDLIPIFFPQYCPVPLHEIFPRWLYYIMQFDGAICDSQAVKKDLQIWMYEHVPHRLKHFSLSWFHLGGDIEQSIPSTDIPSEASFAFRQMKERPTVLMVGRVDPRKGHRQVFAAFESLWQQNVDINLVIAGRQGWDMEATEALFVQHPEQGKRLFRLKDISDEYLTAVYTASTVILMASEAEGFGLPIVEAARHKKPLILRDLPVFREIAGDHAFYFRGIEPSRLANAINHWLSLNAEGRAPSTEGMKILTWKESAQMLLDRLLEDAKHHQGERA